MEEPEIDLLIIIPHYNRPGNISESLKLLTDLCSGIEYRIVISDNGSSNTCYRELFHTIDSLAIDLSTISLRRNLQGTGDLGSHIKSILKDGIPKSRFIWLLGDDDLPRTHFAPLFREIVCKYRSSPQKDVPIVVFTAELSSLSSSKIEEDILGDTIEIDEGLFPSLGSIDLRCESSSKYYKSLLESDITDSTAGLTFISNQIMPANVFEEVFSWSGMTHIDYSKQPLPVLSYCAFNAHIRILPVPLDLVSVAVLAVQTGGTEIFIDRPSHEASDKMVQNYIHVMPQIHVFEEGECDRHVINWFLSHQTFCVEAIINTLKFLYSIFAKHSIEAKHSWLVKLANAYSKKYSSMELLPPEEIQLRDLVWDAMPIGVASFYSHLSGHIHL